MASEPKDPDVESRPGLKVFLEPIFNIKTLLVLCSITSVWFLIWSLLMHSIAGNIISVIMLILTIAAFFLRNKVFVRENDGLLISRILVIAVFILIIPYISNFDLGQTMDVYDQVSWDSLALGDELPELSAWGDVIENTDAKLFLQVHSVSSSSYKKYVSKCVESGYTIGGSIDDPENGVYNDNGYQLIMSYDTNTNILNINLFAPVNLSKDFSFPAGEYRDQIPTPGYTKGTVVQNDENGLAVYVDTASKGKYSNYMKQCIRAGFTIYNEEDKTDTYYRAKNEAGYVLTLQYFTNKTIYIAVSVPEFDVPAQVEYKYQNMLGRTALDFYVDGTFVDTVEDINSEYTLTLARGNHIFRFQSHRDANSYTETELTVSSSDSLSLSVEKQYGGGFIVAEVSSASDDGSSTSDNSTPYFDFGSDAESIVLPTFAKAFLSFEGNEYAGASYLLFSSEGNQVYYVNTSNKTFRTGTYEGDFSSGASITWSDRSSDEPSVFTYQEAHGEGTFQDASGTVYTYSICDINEAVELLKSVLK